MGVLSARIDNRLLHGIVASQWAPLIGAQRIMVIDDEVAGHPVMKQSMSLGRPAGTAISIISLETAIANFQQGKYEGQTIYILVKTPDIILSLQEAGVKIPKLCIGGTAVPEEKATAVSKRAYVTEQQKEVYKKISTYGTKLTVQYIPADTEKSISEIIAL